MSTHLYIDFIIETTMRWAGVTNKAAMMASLMGLLEKNTTITTLNVEREGRRRTHKKRGTLVSCSTQTHQFREKEHWS